MNMAKFCTSCGAPVEEGQNNCTSCGAPIGGAQTQAQPNFQQQQFQQPYAGGVEQKSKMVAGLLQLFLGGFGVGRFYLGYSGMAVAQILVTIFTCGIGGIWPFIDGIMILTGSVKTDANGVPLKD
jgi:TM2 domain-containing membrane protein YozV